MNRKRRVFRRGPIFGILFLDVTWLSDGLVFRWPGCQVVWMSGCMVVRLLGVRLHGCQIAWLSGGLIVKQPRCQMVWLSGGLVVKLSGCQVAWLGS